jgi:uncharacterized membrane protein YcjF (UPF0283 family)
MLRMILFWAGWIACALGAMLTIAAIILEVKSWLRVYRAKQQTMQDDQSDPSLADVS